jgi:excisionase family DNA binding protein
MNSHDLLLSKAVVMERLGVSDKTLRRLVKQGRLRAVKLGKTSPLKFRQLDIAQLLESAAVSGTLYISGAPVKEPTQ